MYVMFVLVAAGGLMATAQLAPIANDFQIAKIPVSLLGLTLPALTFALSIDRVLNGLTRPFFGWVSDRSAVRTRCSSPSRSKQWGSVRSAPSATTR
jgi:OFA family oxalate/formate antiporter-like MFS transporter